MCIFLLFPSLLCCRFQYCTGFFFLSFFKLTGCSMLFQCWTSCLAGSALRNLGSLPSKMPSSLYACPGAYNNQSCSNCTEWPTLSFSSLSWATYTPASVWLTGWLIEFRASNMQLISIFKDLKLGIMQVYVVLYIKLFLRVFLPKHLFLTVLNWIKLAWIRRGKYMISFTV